MTKKDFFDYIDDIRVHKQCSGLYQPNYTHKQRDSDNKLFKGSICELLLYPQDDTHYNALKKICVENAYSFCLIVHDRDKKEKIEDLELLEDGCDLDLEEAENENINNNFSLYGPDYKQEHIHCILQFESRRYNTGIAKELGISSNYVKVYSSRFKKARLLYLLHLDDRSKYQYSINNCLGSCLIYDLIDYINDYHISDYEKEEHLLNYINKYKGFLSLMHFNLYCNDNGFRRIIWGSSWARWVALINEHNKIWAYKKVRGISLPDKIEQDHINLYLVDKMIEENINKKERK